MRESDSIMRMTPAEALALAEKAKAGVPADVRRLTLYAAWLAILQDRMIPTRKKPSVFSTICDTTEIEVVRG